MTEQNTTALPPTPPIPNTNARKPVKTRYWEKIIADRLDMAKRETDYVYSNPEIRRILADYGYDQQRIEEFVAVYEAAVGAQSKQQKEFGDQTGAYARFENFLSMAKKNFSAIRKIAKIALRYNAQKIKQLGLNDKYGKSIGSVFDAMQTFYDNAADGEIYAAFAKFGFTAERIENYRAGFVAARKAHNAFIIEDSEAVEATRIRDEKMAVLDEWMMDYYSISKIALANRPELSTEQQG